MKKERIGQQIDRIDDRIADLNYKLDILNPNDRKNVKGISREIEKLQKKREKFERKLLTLDESGV